MKPDLCSFQLVEGWSQVSTLFQHAVRSERPEQAAAAIGAAGSDIGVRVVAEPVVMASVEVVRGAATSAPAGDVAMAVMNRDGVFAGRNAPGVAGRESECIAAETNRGGDADPCEEKLVHDFDPLAALTAA